MIEAAHGCGYQARILSPRLANHIHRILNTAQNFLVLTVPKDTDAENLLDSTWHGSF